MLRAIDAQQVILQSNATERVQQIQQQHQDMQQKYFELQLSEEHHRLKEKVKDTKEPEEAGIKEERERKRMDGEPQREKQEKKSAAPPVAPSDLNEEDAEQGGHINIKV